MIVEHYENQPQTMALRPKLARSEVRGPNSYMNSHALTPVGFAHWAKPEQLRADQHTGLRQNKSPVRL